MTPEDRARQAGEDLRAAGYTADDVARMARALSEPVDARRRLARVGVTFGRWEARWIKLLVACPVRRDRCLWRAQRRILRKVEALYGDGGS